MTMNSPSQALRVVSWNINCGIPAGSTPTHVLANESLAFVASVLRRLDPDIIMLQEILFPPDTRSQAAELASALDFPFYGDWELSPSHLLPDAGLGIGILSRFPILRCERFQLDNPLLQLHDSDGELQSHDKGVLFAHLQSPNYSLWAGSGHLFPFHRFKSVAADDRFRGIWRALSTKLLSVLPEPAVIGIDLNSDDGFELLRPSIGPHYASLISGPTRPDGSHHDYILTNLDSPYEGARILRAEFDHYACIADVALTQQHVLKSYQHPTTKSSVVQILHLSDLHFGPGEREDVDWKSYIDYAARERRLDRLREVIAALPKPPDFAVITGDITIAGNKEGYQDLARLVDELIASKRLPPADRILVVPGNHDVLRITDGEEQERWSAFNEGLGGRFTRPWIPSIDGTLASARAQVERVVEAADNVVGGVRHSFDSLLGRSAYSIVPFLWDRKHGVLFFLFNSASIAQSRIAIPPQLARDMEWLKRWEDPNAPKIQSIVEAFRRELAIDPARVDPRELSLFRFAMGALRKRFPHEIETSIKIAVLHHHILPVFPEEVRKFELLTNAGQLRQELAQEGFDIVLHGHKHYPEIMQMGIVGENFIFVIAGGTISGGEPPGKEPGFFLHELRSSEREIVSRYVSIGRRGQAGKLVESSIPRRVILSLTDASDERATGRGTRLSLEVIGRATEAELVRHLHRERVANRTRIGWSHSLGEPRVSTVATAYGLRIMDLIRGGSRQFKDLLDQIADSLVEMRHSDGGWTASSQSGKRSLPEASAFVWDALYRWNRIGEVDASIAAFEENGLIEGDDVLWRHTYSLSTVARVLSTVAPESPWLARFSEAIEGAAFRDRDGLVVYWGRHTLRDSHEPFTGSSSRPSIIHTAHCVYALRLVYEATLGRAGLSAHEVGKAAEWLLGQLDWRDSAEDINRPLGDGKWDSLVVKHFTTPWCIIALIKAGVDPAHPRLRREIHTLASSHRSGLWDWGDVERPIWATYDALLALFSYASEATAV